jgi:hypothetical protein
MKGDIPTPAGARPEVRLNSVRVDDRLGATPTTVEARRWTETDSERTSYSHL